MTARQLYEGVLIELNKENAPNVLLEDFNYFANKAVNNYVNKRYNIYDVNQQTTDDLRVLKATALLKPTLVTDKYLGMTMAGDNKMATYEVIMPSDYLHILNCICIYNVNKTYKCYNAGDTWRAPATRLTADMYSLVLDNFWNKPTYKRPYYYIHNVNSVLDFEDEDNETTDDGYLLVHGLNPTNPYDKNTGTGTDIPKVESFKLPNGATATDGNGDPIAEGAELKDANGLPIVLDWKGINSIELRPQSGTTSTDTKKYSLVQKSAGVRYGNVSQVRLEIRYGTDNSVFLLTDVYVDYIKSPQNIRLTQEQIDKTEDVSQMLEYPDYVCQEIINELVHLIMENISDLRLQTHPVVSQSIANPAQALAPAQGLSAQ